VTDIQKVTLGGKEFLVPPLVIKQLRVVFPSLGKIVKLLNAANPMAALSSMEQEDFDRILDVVFVGVSGGSPGFRREQFDALTASPDEIFGALLAVGRAAGLKMAEKKEGAAGDGAAGEAGATSQSTLTDSSRESLLLPDGPGITSKEA
jgi:hypothetical protein